MGRARILLAKDQPDAAGELREKLSNMGYTVAAIASSGKQAVEAAGKTRPNLALIDVRLDGKMDGIAAACRIRERLDIPVVFLSGSADDQTLKRTKRAAPYGYLTSPFEAGDIRAAVEIALQRHAAETRLRKSSERYRALYEHSPTINVVIGPNGVISDVNKSFEQTLGYSKEEVVGRHTLEFVVPHHSGRVAELLSWGPDGSYIPEVDVDVYAKDGSVHTLLFSPGSTVPSDVDRHGGGQLVSGVDITDRRQAQLDLGRSERRLRAIFDAAHDAIFIKDNQLRYAMANPAATRLFGLDQQDMSGHCDEELFGVDCAAELKQADARAMDGQAVTQEHRLPVRDQVRTFEITRAPVYDGAGRAVGLCGIARDVTNRKQAEQERHRTAQQLHESRRLESIGRLAGGIAHHFNNLLTVIQGNAQLLKIQRPDDKDLACPLDQILDATSRSEELTRQLLSYARNASCRVAELDVHALIDKVASLLRPRLDARTAIEFDLQAASATIMGDAAQLQTTLMNLGLNARDALPAGGEITFATHKVALDRPWLPRHPGKVKTGRYLQVSVIDNGVGMDKEALSRAFEPFFTTKKQSKAAGMGLANVYACVKNHRGAVDIVSEQGRGTTVKLYLPLAGTDALLEDA